jgi:membrane associated rhomboid family serine protease
MGEFFTHWQRTRKRGKVRFVLLNGVLIWGLVTAFIFCVIMALFFKQFGSLMHVALAAAAFTIIGAWGTAILWNRNEKKLTYWRSLAKKPKPSTGEEASSPR